MKSFRANVTVDEKDYRFLKQWADKNGIVFRTLQKQAFKELVDKIKKEEKGKAEV